MNCPQCQHVLRDDARFCDGCGLSMSSFNTPTEIIDTAALDEMLPRPDPLLGQVLDAKYELVSRLGEGGMGAVYRARRVHIGDEVAVKVLHRSFVADADAVERFRREARAAAILRHPNVVTIHDFGEARGPNAPAYIVMELVEGTSLRALLRAKGRMAPARAVALMQDICAGVGAAHRRGIVHRDLKPDNIIVLLPDGDGERETAKVVDFGIAKLRDLSALPTLTQAGTLMGTPYYMSPEQCRGDALDARSDVYSLGAMFYEMLAGGPPFTAASVTGVVAKHLTEAPPPLPLNAQVTRALERVCLRALAKDVDARQPEATTLARELQAALDAPVEPEATATSSDTAAARPPASFPVAQTPNISATGGATAAHVAAVSVETTQPTIPSAVPASSNADPARRAEIPPASAPRAGKSAGWQWGGLILLLGAGLISGIGLLVYLAGSSVTPSDADRSVESGVVPTPATNAVQPRAEQQSVPVAEGLLRVLTGHDKEVKTLTFSPDGRTLATGSEDKTVRLWDAATGQLQHTLADLGGEVTSVAFSPDASLLAVAQNYNPDLNNYSVIVVDARAETFGEIKQNLTPSSGPILFVAFSPDGKTLFGGSYRGIQLWDAGTGALRREHSIYEINPSFALAADGTLIATGGTNEKPVKVWDAETGDLKLTLNGHDKGVLSLAFSPDGRTVASGSYDNTVRLWDAESGALKRTLMEESLNAIFSLAFAPDGRTVASGSFHEIKLWDAESGALQRTLAVEGMGITYSMNFSPDGKTLAAASDKTVKLWDVGGIK